jgi:hypothetical protein
MSQNEHLEKWIGPYHDGELKGRRLRMVEKHIQACSFCQEELGSFQSLSSIIQDTPGVVEHIGPEAFVSKVLFQLERKPERILIHQVLHSGWRLAPAGLLGTWAFLQAVFIVSGLLSFGLNLTPEGKNFIGWLPSQGDVNSFNFFNLFDLGILNFGGVGFDLLGDSNIIGARILLYLGLMVVGGLLYISWLTSWWVIQRYNLKSTPSFNNIKQKGVKL